MTEVIDFHIHFTPEQLVRPHLKPDGKIDILIQHGLPAYTYHDTLFLFERHIQSMDTAGIDVAVLSSGAGMGGTQEVCELINATANRVQHEYPNRFSPLAHVDPANNRWRDELKRCSQEYGFQGIAFPSSFDSFNLDDDVLDPLYEALQDAGMFIFVHPALSVSAEMSHYYNKYDLYRCVGREHELVVATYRLIAGGVFDKFPELEVVMSHLGGGIGAIIARIRGYQDKAHMGLAPDSPHSITAKEEFDYYIARNLFFDTGGLFGSTRAIDAALTELPASRIVFGTDYPQEIRDAETMAKFVKDLKESDLPPEVIRGILGDNGAHLIGHQPHMH